MTRTMLPPAPRLYAVPVVPPASPLPALAAHVVRPSDAHALAWGRAEVATVRPGGVR